MSLPKCDCPYCEKPLRKASLTALGFKEIVSTKEIVKFYDYKCVGCSNVVFLTLK